MSKNNWLSPWFLGTIICCLVLISPIGLVFSSLAVPQIDVWRHLSETVLIDYVVNSLLLAFGVGLLVILIGTPLAWFIARFDFIGRKQIQWIVLLPMAMPAYIIGYSYTGLLDFAGPIQTELRELFGWQYGDYYFPEIRSLGGAILMLGFVLYPYVYMLAKSAFSEVPKNLEEVSNSLGASSSRYIIAVLLPLARPAILMGTALAMMEAFADYGTVQYFGISTFTTGIFRTWFGLGNGMAAAQLAALLTSFVVILLLLEFYSRRKIRYYSSGQKAQSYTRTQLTGMVSITVAVLCLLPVLIGFVIPTGQLVVWAYSVAADQLDSAFVQLVWNSFYLAAITSLCAVGLALFFAYAKRLNTFKPIHILVSSVSLGYALPGTVIAIGALLILSQLDIVINQFTEAWFNVSVGLILSGTLFALVLVYCIRFLAVAMHNIDTGMARITPNLDNAAKSLGSSSGSILCRIHIPLLKTSVLSALLLVFVDVLKELPATLVLRPFNFNTLAVKTFELASDERLMQAALPALSIVVVGLIPVALLTRMTDKNPTTTMPNKKNL